MQHAGRVRPVGRALAGEVGEEDHAFAARGFLAREFGQLLVAHAKGLLHFVGHGGAVLGADQGQPASGRITEWGDLTVRVDDGLRRITEQRAAGAEADDQQLGIEGAGAQRGHHVVARPGRDADLGRQAEQLGNLQQQGAMRFIVRENRRQHVGYARVDPRGGFQVVRTRDRIKDPIATGVARIRRVIAGQPTVQPIVGELQLGDAREQLGVMLLQPHQLGRREPRRHRATAGLGQGARLGFRLDIAPQLGRMQHFAGVIEHHHAVLLTTHADRAHPGTIHAVGSERFLRGLHKALPPVGRILLGGTRSRTRRRGQSATGTRDHAARVRVKNQDFDTLRAEIDSEIQGHRDAPPGGPPSLAARLRPAAREHPRKSAGTPAGSRGLRPS